MDTESSNPNVGIDSGDVSWVLVSACLVVLMIFGIGFFYAGQLRYKNHISTIGYIFITYSVISLVWFICAFSLTYGPATNQGGFIGNLSNAVLFGLQYQELNVAYSKSVPFTLFFFFEAQFAAATGALILGGVVERIRLAPFLVFIALWTIFVYAPIGCWYWNANGFLNHWGAMDFAGGCAVEINSGFSALAISFVIGKRNLHTDQAKFSNVPMGLLGVAILWVGWFGFNAGSAYAANTPAIVAIINTNMAGLSAGLAYLVLDWTYNKKPSMMMFGTGAISGLVAITPAAGYIDSSSSLCFGIIAGILCYYFIKWQKRTKYWDDPVDLLASHGIGGCWGMIALGFFANSSVNPIAHDGVFFGNSIQILKQFVGVVLTVAWSTIISGILMWIISLVMNIRVPLNDEDLGLDWSIHSEEAQDTKSMMELSSTISYHSSKFLSIEETTTVQQEIRIQYQKLSKIVFNYSEFAFFSSTCNEFK